MSENHNQDIHKTCGFVMPISAIGTYTVEHWEKIKFILSQIVKNAGFENSELVSYDDVNPDIKSRIINNIFSIPIIICDVSGNNPNVLYELGLRVGFDMPIIVVKDEQTRFNFDLNSFEHVIYPDDIECLPAENRKREAFEERLKIKLIVMAKAYKNNSQFVSPLKNYLIHENYLKIKRGVPFDIEGSYEYLCYRHNINFSQGGTCLVKLINSFGNLMEWQLKGQRCWTKADSSPDIQKFNNPFRWETKKAVVFPDKSFMLYYNIKTDKNNIFGLINGEVEIRENTTIVESLIGEYYQDEGSRLIKGGFKMIRVPYTVYDKNYNFIMLNEV